MTWVIFYRFANNLAEPAVQANVDRETTAWRVEHQDLRLYAFLMRSIAICSPS
jgi:hypothetical protein